MNTNLASLVFGVAIGFVLAWARMTDPQVIRNMLLLREPDVFLLMGSAVAVAAVGVRLLRGAGARAIAIGEAIGWTLEKPAARHVMGSVLFGTGWGVAGTCPAPLAAMIGEGRLGGFAVAGGVLTGALLQRVFERSRSRDRAVAVEVAGAAGL
jgi:uncharacterized membrane protein YedE/YeeE